MRALISSVSISVLILTIGAVALLELPRSANAQSSQTTPVATSTLGEARLSELPSYQPLELEEDTLTSVGSDSMGGLMTRWIAEYGKAQPTVKLRVTSRGSASAPPALIEGSADLGPMARTMKTTERRDFLAAYGFAPTKVQVAFAAVGIYVAADSPIDSLTVAQLRQIFGQDKPDTWSGVEGVGNEDSTLSVFGQTGHPYLSGYFRQKVLLQKPFSADIAETVSAEALYEVVERNKGAIGFASLDLNYPKERVKLLAIADDATSSALLPSVDTIADASYPLSRSLNIYIALEPNVDVEDSLQDFLSFILSKEGQEIVVSQGLIPLSNVEVTEQMSTLQ